VGHWSIKMEMLLE